MDERGIHKAGAFKKDMAFVRNGLEIILTKSPESWIPEDIYSDCFTGKSMLWVFVEDQPCGFVVLQPIGDICIFGVRMAGETLILV